MAAGASIAHPGADIVAVPLGDGGEGTLDALTTAGGGEIGFVSVRDALGRTIEAPVARLSDGRVVVESATASGLALLDRPEPLAASTIGVGDLIGRAIDLHGTASEIVVAVGGTATTDGGTGAAAALGWRFFDGAGDELPPGGAALATLHAIDGSGVDARIAECSISAACDVSHRLTGPNGAARVFGPQKGASAAGVGELERGLERLAEVARRDLSLDLAGLVHGGAGGGLGAGLRAFFGAELVSGFDLVASASGLATRVADADLVVTGEGRVDESSREGKVVAGVIALARATGVRCIVIAGEIAGRPWLPEDVGFVDLLDRYGSHARTDAARCVTAAVAELLGD